MRMCVKDSARSLQCHITIRIAFRKFWHFIGWSDALKLVWRLDEVFR